MALKHIKHTIYIIKRSPDTLGYQLEREGSDSNIPLKRMYATRDEDGLWTIVDYIIHDDPIGRLFGLPNTEKISRVKGDKPEVVVSMKRLLEDYMYRTFVSNETEERDETTRIVLGDLETGKIILNEATRKLKTVK